MQQNGYDCGCLLLRSVQIFLQDVAKAEQAIKVICLIDVCAAVLTVNREPRSRIYGNPRRWGGIVVDYGKVSSLWPPNLGVLRFNVCVVGMCSVVP